MTPTASPGPLALVGSGEYLPQMADVEAGLLAGRPRRYVQLATAAVPDGLAVVERWHKLGVEQAQRIGAEAVVVPVKDRRDADDRLGGPDRGSRVDLPFWWSPRVLGRHVARHGRVGGHR